jgi:hypothetical protein
MSMNLEEQTNMLPLQVWKISPMQCASGIKSFQSLYKTDPNQGMGEDLEDDYKALRRQILTPPYGKRITRAAIGPSGSNKSSLQMGWRRLLLQDQFLKTELEKLSLKLEIITLPYSLIPELYKYHARMGWVPNTVRMEAVFGTYLPSEHQTISRYGFSIIEDKILNPPLPDHHIQVLLPESSAPTVYPSQDKNNKVPVNVIGGADRGNSIIYNLALHPQTRKNFVLCTTLRNPNVYSEALRFRSGLDLDKLQLLPTLSADETRELLKNTFAGKTQPVRVMPDGEEKEIEKLSLEEQKKVLVLLSRFMASPFAISQSDKELEQNMGKLFREKIIKNQDDFSYAELINQRLGLKKRQRRYLSSHWAMEDITYDLGYFLDSFWAHLTPQILEV